MSEHLRTTAYAVAYITFALGLSTVFLRLYCRGSILKSWGCDDRLAIIVGVISCGQQAILHLFLYWGCGLHVSDVSGIAQLQILKVLFVEEVYYYFVHWVIKMAFLCFYLRLSPGKTFRLLVYIGMATNTIFFIVNLLIAILQCVPFDEIFHPGSHPDAKCLPKLVLLVVPSLLNIFQDIYILVLPISTVLNLQMSLRRKIAVLSVISFGASAVLVACFRLIPLFELNSSTDFSYILGKMVIYAAIEIQLAIVAMNLPPLKALWLRLTGGSTSNSDSGPSKDRGYKLSSIKGGSQDLETIGGSSRYTRKKNKMSRGSLTNLEHFVRGTESEEELFKQVGIPTKNYTSCDQPDGGIVVTTEVSQSHGDALSTPGTPFPQTSATTGTFKT